MLTLPAVNIPCRDTERNRLTAFVLATVAKRNNVALVSANKRSIIVRVNPPRFRYYLRRQLTPSQPYDLHLRYTA